MLVPRRIASRLTQRVITSTEFAVLVGLLVVGSTFALTTANFLTSFNLFLLTRQMTILMVIAIGRHLLTDPRLGRAVR